MKKNSEIKINEMESNIVDIKITLNNPKYIEELKKEKEKLIIESEIIKISVLHIYDIIIK